jgi:DNA-binding XRE family transcriptional regulator
MSPAQLREIRSKLGWTQSHAAETLDVSLRQYKHYEAGDRDVPHMVALSMRVYEFVYGLTQSKEDA